MADIERPQIYLITPPEIDLAVFPDQLSAVLDNTDVACVRMALSSKDESVLARSGDALREITHARDVALVIEEHLMMVERLGLDGVHLTDGARSVRHARKELGADAIIGTFCGTSRHEGISAGEAGVEYVSFGPIGASALGDGSIAETDLFTWWSEMIEVPVVAEGNLDKERVAELCSITDFFGFGDEIWGTDNPSVALADLMTALS